jgi:hypothetical protein
MSHKETMMRTRRDLLARADFFETPATGGIEREFHLALSAVYRTLAEMVATVEVPEVLAPAA